MAACESGAKGRVVLEVETEASGQVREARILASEPEGLFDETALEIARGSRLSPAYRYVIPLPATALLALRCESESASCSIRPDPDGDAPSRKRPPPRVTQATRYDERKASRVEWCAAPCPGASLPVP